MLFDFVVRVKLIWHDRFTIKVIKTDGISEKIKFVSFEIFSVFIFRLFRIQKWITKHSYRILKK